MTNDMNVEALRPAEAVVTHGRRIKICKYFSVAILLGSIVGTASGVAITLTSEQPTVGRGFGLSIACSCAAALLFTYIATLILSKQQRTPPPAQSSSIEEQSINIENDTPNPLSSRI